MVGLGSRVLRAEGLILRLLAGENITAGQVVGYLVTGSNGVVIPADDTDSRNSAILGVALEDVSPGEPVAVASVGSVCKVLTTVTDVHAGQWVTSSSTAGEVTVYGGGIPPVAILGLALSNRALNGLVDVLITLGVAGV